MEKFMVRLHAEPDSLHLKDSEIARERAQQLADEHRAEAALYELAETFQPKPEAKMVICNIDELIGRLEKVGVRGLTYSLLFALLKQLKGAGITTLEMSPGFKL